VCVAVGLIACAALVGVGCNTPTLQSIARLDEAKQVARWWHGPELHGPSDPAPALDPTSASSARSAGRP